MNRRRTPLSFYLPASWEIASDADCCWLVDGNDTGKPKKKIHSGCIIGTYELTEFLGEGGSCLCYRALDTESGRIVVIKELYPYEPAERGLIIRSGADLLAAEGISEEDTALIKRIYERGFSHELNAVGNLKYIRTESGWNNDSRFFSAFPIYWEERKKACALNQEFLVIDTSDGISLDLLQLSTAGKDRILECCELTLRILEAVRIMHQEKRRLHLDISPSNIYISNQKIGSDEHYGKHLAMLIDYGSSFELNSEGGVILSGEVFSASPGYAAPELKEQRIENIGPQTDLYSVMKVFQELLIRDVTEKANSWRGKIKKDRHFQTLPPVIQEVLIHFVEKKLGSGRDSNAEEAIKDIETLIDIIRMQGIHREVIAARAEEKAAQFSSEINRSLLCQVEQQ